MTEHDSPETLDELVVVHRRLIGDLDEVARLLRRIDSDLWAEWMERDAARIDSGDLYGLTHLLSAYGGMGSFSDLVVDPRNGVAVTDAEADILDHRLSELRGQIWLDARSLLAAYQADAQDPT